MRQKVRFLIPIVAWSFKRFVTKTSFSGRMKMLQNFTSIKQKIKKQKFIFKAIKRKKVLQSPH